jgi:hypothetical protein
MRTGEVGSVGVVAIHLDESGADAKAGLAWTFVFAGDRKIDGGQCLVPVDSRQGQGQAPPLRDVALTLRRRAPSRFSEHLPFQQPI